VWPPTEPAAPSPWPPSASVASEGSPNPVATVVATFRRRPLMQALAVVAVVAVLVAGFIVLRAGSPKHQLTGSLTVVDFGGEGCGQAGSGAASKLERLDALMNGKTFPCSGGPGGGYSDLADGAGVQVSDGAGKLLATSSLTGGQQSLKGVTFRFTVAVPDEEFYKVQIANRGELPYSRADLEKKAWKVSAVLK
jgi:hypothetical protein